MTEPIVFGAAYSVYVRAVRLALAEKGVPYRLAEVDVFAERVRVAQSGGSSDEAKIAAALVRARTCLAALESLMGEGPWLAAAQVSLADLRAFPIFALFRKAPEGARLLDDYPGLARWFEAMARRPSVMATPRKPRVVLGPRTC